MEKIVLSGNEGDTLELFILEKTTLGGVDYMLGCEEETGDCDAYILKDMSKTEDAEGVYEIVSDETELKAVGQVFQSLLEDADIQ